MLHFTPTNVLLYCPPAHLSLTCVDAGATIQATPPALHIILEPSGNELPTLSEETNFACHQGVGPNFSFNLIFLYLL